MTAKTTTAAPKTPEGAAQAPATPETTAPKPEIPEGARDAVAAVSLRADGTPDQTPGYVQLIKD